MSSTRKITLRSSDGESFVVDEAVAVVSQTIKHMIEDDCADRVIPIPNVTGRILAKVVEYCKEHVESQIIKRMIEGGCADSEILAQLIGYCKMLVESRTIKHKIEDDLKAWDAEFVKVDHATLFDLILAANYLNIKSLLYLTCQAVADMAKGKTSEEIRKTFNIKTGFTTPEEEEEVRRENQWAFVTVLKFLEELRICSRIYFLWNVMWSWFLILAANYLNIKGLLDLTCRTVADRIKGKTPEEIRRTFNIRTDPTPEEEEEEIRRLSTSGLTPPPEEEEVRRENQWAFE